MADEIGLRGYRVKDPGRMEERRNAILLAAAAVFAEKGYMGATLEDVADRMGTSRGVIYYQFRNKEEIYVEIVTSTEIQAAERLQAIIDSGQSPTATLHAAIADLIRTQFEELDRQSTALGRQMDLSPEAHRRIREADRAYSGRLLEIVSRGVTAGEFAPRDPKLMTYTLIHAAQSTTHWFRPGAGPLTAARVTEELAEMLLTSVLKHPGAATDGTA